MKQYSTRAQIATYWHSEKEWQRLGQTEVADTQGDP